MKLFDIVSQILYVIIVTYIIWRWKIYNRKFDGELRDFGSRLIMSTVNNEFADYTVHSMFNLTVYQSPYEPGCFMLILNPQRYHFFIERGKIIYHPLKCTDGILKQYACLKDYEHAYLLPVVSKDDRHPPSPKVICHRKLDYLTKYVYTTKLYSRNYMRFQGPFKVISEFFYTLQKIDSINQIIKE